MNFNCTVIFVLIDYVGVCIHTALSQEACAAGRFPEVYTVGCSSQICGEVVGDIMFNVMNSVS